MLSSDLVFLTARNAFASLASPTALRLSVGRQASLGDNQIRLLESVGGQSPVRSLSGRSTTRPLAADADAAVVRFHSHPFQAVQCRVARCWAGIHLRLPTQSDLSKLPVRHTQR